MKKLTEAQKFQARTLVRIAHTVKNLRKDYKEPHIPIEIKKAAAERAGIFITKRY